MVFALKARRGWFQTRPYIFQKDYPMDMIRHYYKSVQLHIRIMLRQIEPSLADDLPIIIYFHLLILDFSE